jgi:hypothetical protein
MFVGPVRPTGHEIGIDPDADAETDPDMDMGKGEGWFEGEGEGSDPAGETESQAGDRGDAV